MENIIAVLPITNTCSICITDINDEYVNIIGFKGDKHCYKLYSNNNGFYFNYAKNKYYIEDFMRL